MLWVLIRSTSSSNEYPLHMFLWRNKKNMERYPDKYFSYFSMKTYVVGTH